MALDVVVTQCLALGKVDQATADQWHAYVSRFWSWYKATPFLGWFGTGSLTDQGEALQRELATWHDKIRALGCANVPATPVAPPAPVNPAPLLSSLPTIAVLALGYLLLREVKR